MTRRSRQIRRREQQRVRAVGYLYERGFTKKEVWQFKQQHKYRILRGLTKEKISDYYQQFRKRRYKDERSRRVSRRHDFIDRAKFERVFTISKKALLLKALTKDDWASLLRGS